MKPSSDEGNFFCSKLTPDWGIYTACSIETKRYVKKHETFLVSAIRNIVCGVKMCLEHVFDQSVEGILKLHTYFSLNKKRRRLVRERCSLWLTENHCHYMSTKELTCHGTLCEGC